VPFNQIVLLILPVQCLYEKGKDPRISQRTGGRSINLALSVHSEEALKVVGILLAKSVKLFV